MENLDKKIQEKEKSPEKVTIKGNLYLINEMGDERSYWAIIDGSVPPELQTYEDELFLRNGDTLTIFDKEDPKKQLWKGKIDFEKEENSNNERQKGVDPKLWGKWFTQEYPARLEFGKEAHNNYWRTNNERINTILKTVNSKS